MRFNAIRPGFITTEIMEGIPRDSAVYESYIENTPMQDVGEPEDVADLARFLLGPESRWITGRLINVDGGHACGRARLHLVHRAGDRPRRHGRQGRAARQLSVPSTGVARPRSGAWQ